MQSDATKKTKWARRLAVIGWLIVCGALAVAYFRPVTENNATRSQKELQLLTIANQPLRVEVAKTKIEHARGLCCRDSLAADSGMLFIYGQPGVYRFWMKDTKIPLDMFWISSQKQVIHVEKNVQPDSYPQSFGPDIPAQYILETNAGFAEAHNIKLGDKVNF